MDRTRIHHLVLLNLGLAGKLAGQWQGKIPGCDRDDLFQECLVALLIAAEDWDEDRLEFDSWAWLCMERHLGTIRARGDLVKVPLYLRALVERVRLATQQGAEESAAIAALPTTAVRRELVAFALQARRPVGRVYDESDLPHDRE